MKKYLTIPNLLTTIHFILLFPFVYFFAAGNKQYALLFFLAGFTTDILDGYLARRLKQETDFGRLYDSFVDSAFFITIIVFSVMKMYLPISLATIYLASGILFAVAFIKDYFKSKKIMSLKSPFFLIGSIINLFVYLSLILEIKYSITYALIVLASAYNCAASFKIYTKPK